MGWLNGQLRVSRGWPKGHAGKVLRKQTRKLIRQGHHAPLDARNIVMARHGLVGTR